MIKFLFIASILLLSCAIATPESEAPKEPKNSVSGKIFIGKEEAQHQDGCEGCGNRGQITFFENGKADLLFSGSDIMESATYTQSKGKIIFGDKLDFTLSEDGKSIHRDGYGTYIYDREIKPEVKD